MYNISAKSLFIGQNVIQLEECFSTNDFLKELSAGQNLIEGTLLLTFNQTNGKGQLENKWMAEPFKNMTFSIFLKPNFISLDSSFDLSIITSLAVFDFITCKCKNADVKIKWPNDIYADNKKIAGILIENNISGNKIAGSIIGIGININQTDFGELNHKATSLKNITHSEYYMGELYGEFVEIFEKRYLLARTKGANYLKNEYLNHLLKYQERAFFTTGDTTLEGIIIGVNKDGKLALQIDHELRYFDIKEIGFVI